ncbi:MAG: hypothetical protein ACRC0V_01930, partial [Fusobacteriaceae bacterium]
FSSFKFFPPRFFLDINFFRNKKNRLKNRASSTQLKRYAFTCLRQFKANLPQKIFKEGILSS